MKLLVGMFFGVMSFAIGMALVWHEAQINHIYYYGFLPNILCAIGLVAAISSFITFRKNRKFRKNRE